MKTKNYFLKKRILSLVLCFALIFSLFIPSYVNANASEQITIDLKTFPKMDIVLTSKETTLDLKNFEMDLKTELGKKGVNVNNVNIESVETTFVSTETTSASEIFSSWHCFFANNNANTSNAAANYGPGNKHSDNNYSLYGSSAGKTTTASTYYNVINNRVQMIKGAQRPAVAFYDPTALDTQNATISFNYGIDSSNYETFTDGEAGFIFKVQDPLNYYVYVMDNHDLCGNAGYTYKEVLLKSVNGVWYYIDSKTLPAYSAGMNWNLEIVLEGNNIKLYREGDLKFDYTDNTTLGNGKLYTTGSYGFYVWNQKGAYFSNISIDSVSFETFTSTLREPEWREDADHFIVNVDEVIDESFTNPSSMGEILTRTINDDIKFIQWGSDTNKTIMENFIAQNNGNGTFLNGTDYNKLIEDTVDYIVNLYDINESEDQYVIVDSPTNLEVKPENLATNTSDASYPNGKWIIHHNAKYFANGTGQSEYSEQFMDNLNTNFVFDKPGEYKIYYGEDLVKTIYAHRKPIANFSMTLNSDKTLSLVNQSYDLDSNEDKYGLGNGIKEINWQWKNMNDDNWTLGKPTTALIDGESYVVQLVVKDEQNVSSLHTSKYITLDKTIEIPPIAAFSFGNSTIFTNNELEIIDTSYDPIGNALSTYEWTLKKADKVISTSATPTLKFDTSNLGAGEYSYSLRVKNSKGLWSEPYIKSFKVIEDTIAPSVMIEPTYSEWGASSAINFEFMDSGSGFAKFRYTHGETQTPPSNSDSSWSDWSTNDNGSLTINEDGVWYLHIQAYDNNNNPLNRTVGVYRIDTTNPIIDNVIVDDSSIEREIPIVINAHDDTSGIKYYRFVNETSGEDSGYIETNTYNVTTNGVFKVYVQDKNNNEIFVETQEITIVDRVAPNVVTLKVDSNTSDWTTNIETTIKAEDTFAGMNTYSYSLVKVDENGIAIAKNENNIENPFLLNVYAEQNVTYNTLTIDMDTFDVNAYNWQEDDTFNINENGTYNLYARDKANNVSGVQFTIGNIDTIAPTIEKIEKSNSEVTNQDITITIVGANDEHAGMHEKPYSYDNGNSWTSNNTYVITNNTNGEVNVLVRDALENTATFTYSIDNIDKTLPSFEDLSITNNREEKKSTITFSFSDDREIYGYLLKTNSSLPQDSEYITNFEIDNGIVTSEYEVNKNGIYYLFIKDKAGNIYPQKLQIDALVSGIDFSQDKATEYQTIGEENNISTYGTRNTITNEGDFDTYVYVSQQSTFSVVVPKVLVLDGQTGYADYQVSVLGNIAGKETIGVIPNDSFEMKDIDGVKANIVANVSQDKTSFAYDEIINKTTTNGSISAPSISAGRWNGISNFNILVQNNLNIKDSIASVPEDSFALQVDDSAITLK